MEQKSKIETGESSETVSKKLRILKTMAKIIGVIFISFGFVLTVFSYAFGYLFEKEFEPELINLLGIVGFFLGWILFGGGLLICFSVSIVNLTNQNKISKYLDQYFEGKEKPHKSIRFFSFPLSRLIAATFLLIMGYLDLFILTGRISHDQAPYGEVVVLGGPSTYYVIGFIPHIIGIALLLYVLFDSHKANLASSENYFYFNEFRKNTFNHTAIPKKEIEMIRYQNNHVGSKFIWVLILVPFLVLTAINGPYLLVAPRLQDPTQAILFIVTSILEVCALFFLVLRQQNYLEITTKNNYYDTWFAPFKKKLEELPISEGEGKGKTTSEFMKKHDISPTHRHYTTLLTGVFFILSGLIMLVLYAFLIMGIFGNLYTMFSIIFGVILIVKAISQDFSNKNGVQIDHDEIKKTSSFHQNFRHKFVRIETLQSSGVEPTRQFRKLNFFELILIPILLAFSTIQTVQSWMFSTSALIILDSVITTAVLCVVYLLIFLYLCVPLDQLRLTTPTKKYDIPITLTTRKKRFLDGVLSSDLKKSFILRCLLIAIIGVLSLIGTLLYLNLYFFI